MSTFTFAVGVVAVGLWMLVWQWRTRQGPTQFVLRLLPAALLFLVMPVPSAAWQVIRGFQQIAESGVGGVKEAAALSLEIVRPLWVGSLGFLVAIGASAALQAIAAGVNSGSPPASEDTNASRVTWRTWMLLASSLLVLPAGLLTFVTHGIARLVMGPGVELARSVGSSAPAGPDMAQLSGMIANRLVFAMVAGAVLSGVLLLFATANVFLVRPRQTEDPLATYSWMVAAAISAAAAWNAIRLAVDIRSFELTAR